MPQGPSLVTGATGFVGGHLLDRLAGRAPLVGWYRPAGRPADRTREVDWQPVDLLNRAAVRRAIAETEPARVYHLAGAPDVSASWRNVVPHLRTNALGTHYLLDAVRQAGHPCRVLVVSSAQIYQPSDEPLDEDAPLVPPNPYGLSKLAADQLALRAVREDGLDVVVARPFNHAGPRQRPAFAVSSFARQIARIEAGLEPACIKVGNLEARRDLTDVRDVVDAYERLLDRAPAGRAYNVCSGRAWRIADLLDELLHLSRTHVRIDVDGTRLRPHDIPVLQGDATRIRAELGWTPAIPVEQTLRDTLAWWRDQVRADR
jgi:GDP-4-dehydro-6-deoxy-D-mannose reductase